jgi:chromosome segregation ATPase
MSRGITENDVWQAADALLLEGARPTIERVRQKIGRGSPNTVSPHLDTWFKHLGGRIKDPGAFAAPPEVPDPVMQVAKHLWEVAQADARRDLDQRLQVAMAAAVSNVEAEKERAAIAEASAFEAAARATRLQADLAELSAALEHQRIGEATLKAQLEDARQQAAQVASQAGALKQELVSARAEGQRQIDSVAERAASVARRAGLEIDAARQGQARAEKRADGLERKLEAARAELQAATGKVAELSARLEFAAKQHVAAVRNLSADLEVARVEASNLRLLLDEERSAVKTAQVEATTAKALFDRLSPISPSLPTANTARGGAKRGRG